MDCVLITTLPPVPHKQTAPSEQSEDKDSLSRKKIQTRKKLGKQREAAPVPRSLAGELSRSHSVSSLRGPLFEPVGIDLISVTAY